MNRPIVGSSHLRICLVVLLPLLAIRQWLMPLPSSLWLDETATFWIVKDGPSQIFHRCLGWPTQSCLYSWIAWIGYAAAGPNEFALRLPSVLATAATTFLLYRLGARLMDSQTGLLAALAFNLLPGVPFSSVDARPYAFALLSLVGATLVLVRWTNEGRPILGAGYAALASLTVYFHYLFAPAFLSHIVYLVWRLRANSAVGWRSGLGWLTAAGVLTTPLVLGIVDLATQGTSLSFVETTPPPDSFYEALTPPALVCGLVVGTLAAWFLAPGLTFEARPISKDVGLLVFTWWLVPLGLAYAVSLLTPLKVFMARYVVCAAPAIALIFAWLARGIQPGVARGLVAVMLAFIGLANAVGRNVWPIHGGQDWRGAMAFVRQIVGDPQTPVLVRSGFIESADPRWHDRLVPNENLMAPLSIYPAAGRVIPYPIRLDGPNKPFAEHIVSDILANVPEFVAVTSDVPGFHLGFDRLLAPFDFELASSRSFPRVHVLVFRKRLH